MRIINKDELKHDKKLAGELKKSIFIYPTDTIYGVGCDATNPELVARLRNIKQNFEQPFSIIIPNKNLIYQNCQTKEEDKQWVDKLPGPYTLIFKVKKRFFAENVNPGKDTIGIRIPNHWFYNYVRRMQTALVTTSANLSGHDFMTSLDDLDDEVKNKVDFIVYDGPIKGRPSNIIHLETDKLEIKDRSKPSVKEKLRQIRKIFKKNN